MWYRYHSQVLSDKKVEKLVPKFLDSIFWGAGSRKICLIKYV